MNFLIIIRIIDGKLLNSITPWVSVGLKCSKKQGMNSSFDVYFGAGKGFEEVWERNDYNIEKPEGSYFALERRIYDNQDKMIDQKFTIINDFPDDEKYLFSPEGVDGMLDYYIPHYNYFQVETIDFNSIFSRSQKGQLAFYIPYYDEINKRTIDEASLYGNVGPKINYELVDDGFVFFSH